jgi:hypothetical protein
MWLINTGLYNNEQISLSLQSPEFHSIGIVQATPKIRAVSKSRALAQFHGSSRATPAVRATESRQKAGRRYATSIEGHRV